jgi:hypothetical protein
MLAQALFFEIRIGWHGQLLFTGRFGGIHYVSTMYRILYV